MALASIGKNGAKLLFIGRNGSGKSSLINKITDSNVASVGDNIEPNNAIDLVMEHWMQPEDATDQYIAFFDTRGFGDLDHENKTITDKIRSTMKTADVILICNKLYGRVDRYVIDELKDIAKIFGDELMKHAILVFTWGDEYKIHCQSTGQFNDEVSAQEEIKKQINIQISKKVAKIREVLKKNGIKDEIADNIPYCVTSIKEDKLPCTTGDNWKIELWNKCQAHCTAESVPFMRPLDRSKRHNYTTIATIGGVVGATGGVCNSAIFGALIGTGVIPIPGVGAAVGAALGIAIGSIVLGTTAGATISSLTKYAYDEYKEKKAKKVN